MVNNVSDETESENATGSAQPGIFDFDPPPEIDPNKFGPVPIVSVDDAIAVVEDPFDADSVEVAIDEPASTVASGPVTDLPHWTEPATGQVPRVVASSSEDTWNDLGGPRWHGEGPEWAGDDLDAVLGDAPKKVVIDDDVLPPEPAAPSSGDPQRNSPAPVARARATRPSRVEEPSGERNIPQAIGVGLALAAIALLIFRRESDLWALGLVTVVAVLAAIEAFDAMRRAGSHPATLLGIVATAALPVSVYYRGEAAFALVMALTVVFGALWYLSGADTQRPALNLGLTFLGVGWIGVTAGFAGLILTIEDGSSILVAAIVCTAVYDTGALAGGSVFANPGHKFHPASPNKTWEGTITGVVAAVAAGAVLGILEISPFSLKIEHAVMLGFLTGVVAPIGDLTESMVKRDLGVKDMGNLLPGHGGVLDRIDGLLFVLPATYYLSLLLGLA